MIVSTGLGIWLDVLDPIKSRLIEVQKASSNVLVGISLSFFFALPLATLPTLMKPEWPTWGAVFWSGLVGLAFLFKWREYKNIAQKLLLQEAIAKGVEIGMKKAKEG
ncbi:hypothetical protein EP1X_09275 [Thermococcus sp. EP1]|uniref:hypothetical protein n=1 Tax=Thermococcus sp. EP1 TaxID=1591054 RepID=UPI0006DA01DA|nr:hypothetical protein [Thermococcus sp. EP1]KPU62344.1 hypothetical protein EP1X_09275 [Thermococcus sp. EP1]